MILVTNWYKCAPSVTRSWKGSITRWKTGELDCSVAKVAINGTGCDDVVLTLLDVTHYDPVMFSGGYIIIHYDGQADEQEPVHDPCGQSKSSYVQSSPDARGAIYVR